ncbi:hypothetical protein Tco_1132246 [Tanacetum coccineum]|uniref:Integrase, catalytic region, zinc finger, CCHC-type, peptidase aspartic, catalytic n=1 Tax=Tanacetum coccineum TaxID=301880 RepID=A0ABQ5JCS4_9ASTR
MSTFIKNQSSWKLSQLKKLSFKELKTEFEKLMKSIESFVPMETEARVKRHGLQLEQETLKKQKIDIQDASITKGKDEVVKEEETEVPVKKTGMRRKQKARKGINIDKTAQDEFNKEREAYVKDKVKDASSESEIGVDVIPTATKPPTIVNWKIISQSSQKAAYQIIRKDGSDKIYMSFGAMLKDFSRDELVELYRLVIKKYGANTPEEMPDLQQTSSGPALHEMTPATISSGLVPNPHPSTPFVPPSRTDWDILFQPLFDELFNPPPSVDFPAPEVIAPIDEVVAPEPAVSTSTPSSTTVDQDAPSPSNSQTTPETPPPVIPNDVEEDNHDIEVAHMGNDPYFGVPILEIPSDQSSSSGSIHTIVHPDHQISEHNSKWTKDHPLENIIGELARPVSTRLQLHEQALFCYYDAFLTAVEPKTYKDALTQACWIEAMQEELNEFERLEVWELVPRPDKIFGLYTSRLLDAACTSALNLLKKGLLVRGEAKTTSKRRLSRRTTDCCRG